MSIIIRMVSGHGRAVGIDINSHDTIGHLKEMIQDKEGIPSDKQRLVLAARELEDSRTLDDYGMCIDISSLLVPFSAHLAKGNVGYCHHFASVARLSSETFHILIFSPEIPEPNELKLCRKHLWKVLYKCC